VAKPAAQYDWGFPNLATPPGSSTYYSVRFAPAGLRDDLAAVVAWHHQVRKLLIEVSDPGVARAKLQWWREELLRTQAGGARHPLSQALAPVMARHRLPVEPFLAMADAVQADLGGHQPPDRAAWEAACQRDLGDLFELLARCHRITDLDRLAAASALGGFCAQVYRIRDSGLYLRRGRAFLPSDCLIAVGLSPGALALPEVADRLPVLLAEAAAVAVAYRDRGVADADLPVALRVRGRISTALLGVLEGERFDLVQRRVGLTPLRKVWLAWREARRPAPPGGRIRRAAMGS
jgi:15-cis-phytoene synthase